MSVASRARQSGAPTFREKFKRTMSGWKTKSGKVVPTNHHVSDERGTIWNKNKSTPGRLEVL
jgi:hypothetical protein